MSFPGTLGVQERNPAAFHGAWLPGQRSFVSVNPATGAPIAHVITAFNFPAAVWAWNAFIAAVAGNTVVWKPSPKAPLTALAIQHLVNRVMSEERLDSVFSLFLSDEDALAAHFVADSRVALLSFTGSSAVGGRVAEAVGRRMGKCLLECSGNNAVIVDETADLELAVRALVFGAVGTAGQRCTSTRRLLVQESHRDQLVQRLVQAYRQVQVGDPLDPRTLMGPLIDAAAVERFCAVIAELKGLGVCRTLSRHTPYAKPAAGKLHKIGFEVHEFIPSRPH